MGHATLPLHSALVLVLLDNLLTTERAKESCEISGRIKEALVPGFSTGVTFKNTHENTVLCLSAIAQEHWKNGSQ